MAETQGAHHIIGLHLILSTP